MAKSKGGRSSAPRAPKAKPAKPAAPPLDIFARVGAALRQSGKVKTKPVANDALARAAAELRAASAASKRATRDATKSTQAANKAARQASQAATKAFEQSPAEARRAARSIAAKTEQRYQTFDKKTRKVVDTLTGEILSRRQYIKRTEGKTPEAKALDNLLNLKRGADTAAGRKKLQSYLDKRARRKDAQQAFKEHQARKRGVRPRDIQVRGDSPMAELFRAKYDVLSSLRERARERSLGKGNARRYVRALVELGLVSEDDFDEWVAHYMGGAK